MAEDSANRHTNVVNSKPPNRQSNAPIMAPESIEEESAAARIERLGRARPEMFQTIWSEIGFAFSVVMSQILTEYFVSGFVVIIPTLATSLSIPSTSQIWPASAFSLTIACTLLIFGRLGDMYGGRILYLAGITWLALWAVIAGFSKNELMLDFARGLQGLGPAAYLPASLQLLGSVYRPGPRKNLVFSIYGAGAPLGFFVGIFFGGVTVQYASWGWYFWIGAILAGMTGVVACLCLPPDRESRRESGIKMDWWGGGLIVVGLVLAVFAITDSAHAPQGWQTPYILTTFVSGCLILCVAVYVEGWVVEMPLLPGDIFKVKYMKPMVISLLFFYGSMGIILLYGTFYMQNIMHATGLLLVAYWSPTAIGGLIIATLGGLVLHLIPGTFLMIFAGVAWIIAPLLFAVAPPDASYWAYIFPAMICTTLGIDIVFNISNIFITTSMPIRRQGLAGSLINSLVHLGIAVFLGFGDLVAALTANQGELQSYRNALWFEVAIAATALVIMVGFVKVKKAESAATADEIEAEALEEQAKKEGGVGVQSNATVHDKI